MPAAAGMYYFYHEGGGSSKPPLILIHGAGGNYQFWPPEVRRMPGLRVLAVDLPGHGKSDGPGMQSVADYARSLVEFIKAVGIYKAVVAGHALGGAVALDLAIDHARYVAGVALISTGARLPVPSALLEAAANPSMYPPLVHTVLQTSFGPRASEREKQLLASGMAATRPTVFHGDLQACDRFDVSNRLGRVRAPALVLCGTEDRATPPQYSETLATGIPGAALQTIDGAGHMVMLEQPRRVAGALTLFIKTIPYIPGG